MVTSSSNPPGPPQRECFRKRPTLALAASFLLTLAGCGPTSQSQLPSGNPGAPAQAAVSFCDSSAANCTSGTSFAITSVRDLNVVVDWQNLQTGTHAQKISFILPGGELYQAFVKSFAVADGANGAVTTVEALPVAGTWITQRGLTGMWSVTLELDGQAIGTRTVQFTP